MRATSQVLSTLLAAGACSAPAEKQEPGPEGDALVAMTCELMASCECNTAAFPDEQACLDAKLPLYEAAEAAAQADSARHDPGCLEQWIAAVEDRGCAPPGAFDSPVCQIYYGGSELDEGCTYFGFAMSSCAQGLRCYEEVCREWEWSPPPVGEGEYCYKQGDDTVPKLCDAGLFCDAQVTGLCRAGAAEGESCAQLKCGSPLWCDKNAPGGPACRARLGEGEPCSAAFQCETNECEADMGVCVGVDPAVCDLVGP